MKKLAMKIYLIVLLSISPFVVLAQPPQEQILIGLIPEMNVFILVQGILPCILMQDRFHQL